MFGGGVISPLGKMLREGEIGGAGNGLEGAPVFGFFDEVRKDEVGNGSVEGAVCGVFSEVVTMFFVKLRAAFGVE